MSELDRFSSPCDWQMIGEGGGTISFKCKRKDISEFVLRVSKISDLRRSSGSWDYQLDQFVLQSLMADVNKDWIRQVIDHNQENRDAKRISAHPRIDHAGFVFIQPFAHNLSGWSIEIKPKWHGLLSFANALGVAVSIQDHAEYCRYCNHNGLGGYCPDDFFSNDLTRLVKALSYLQQQKINGYCVRRFGNVVLDWKFTTEQLTVIANGLLHHCALRLLDENLRRLWTVSAVVDDDDGSAIHARLFDAAILRDCSLIIHLNESFEVGSLYIIDTDGKSASRLTQYLLEQQNLVEEIGKFRKGLH